MQARDTIRTDFDRIALLPQAGWNHNRHYRADCWGRCHPAAGRRWTPGAAPEVTRLLAARCGHVTGVDLSPNMVTEARKRSAGLRNAEYVVADFMTAPLPAGGFDCVASVAVLHHLPCPARSCASLSSRGPAACCSSWTCARAVPSWPTWARWP